jgi:hypothetical protein
MKNYCELWDLNVEPDAGHQKESSHQILPASKRKLYQFFPPKQFISAQLTMTTAETDF